MSMEIYRIYTLIGTVYDPYKNMSWRHTKPLLNSIQFNSIQTPVTVNFLSLTLSLPGVNDK